jgi:hypothetical protein
VTLAATKRISTLVDALPAVTEPAPSAPIETPPAIRSERVRMRYAEDVSWAALGIHRS